jgi:hypothetical protein
MLEVLGLLSMVFVVWFTAQAFRSGTPNGQGQSRRQSIIEAWVNIVIGFAINFAANIVLIPLMTGGHGVTLASNFWGGWVFTAISILRQYAIRRWFNSHIHEFAARAAERAR